MRDITRSSLVWFGVGLLSLLLTTACNKSSNNESLRPAGGQNSIIGAGSTFVYPIMSRWISTFQGSHPGVQINYQSIGSGGGIQQLKKGLVDFGASDAAFDDEQLKEMPPVIQIPESAGPVCITYNLPELKTPLKLSAATLAGIYLGKITKWQDPAVKKDNAGVNLPNHDIIVAHRSDGSGTTNIFTTYLAKVSPEWAKVGKGVSVSWPVGLGGKDVRTPIVDPPASAKDAYPICGLTYLLVPKDGNDAKKRQTVKDFIQFIITDGQNSAEQLEYAKLPQALADQDQKLIADMQANGQLIQGTSSSASR